MKRKDNAMGNKNPAIQTVLEDLARETVQPEKTDLWPAVRAGLAAGKSPYKHKEFSMNKRIFVPALGAALLLALVAVFMARNATPVSARTILDRASAAQSQALPTEGILHTRYVTFFNIDALPEDQVPGTIQDTYYDLGSCKSRSVTTNDKSGVVLDVHSNDGTHTVGGFNYDINSSGPLTVYRSPNPKDSATVPCIKPYLDGDKEMFDQMRNEMNAEVVGQETWADGRTVYVLRAQVPAKLAPQDTSPTMATLTTYFDVNTYQFLGGKETINKDGKELLIDEKLFTVDENLPAGSSVQWDMSDLKGILIIDDPSGAHYDDGARG